MRIKQIIGTDSEKFKKIKGNLNMANIFSTRQRCVCRNDFYKNNLTVKINKKHDVNRFHI